jgi:5-methylcytosine-specific restriction endonuclease McrA
VFKRVAKKCFFCPCDIYGLLDVHRIVPGEEGGRYTEFNSVTTCANCHRKMHEGIIKIIGKHSSTAGYVLHYIDENGEEKWKGRD